MMTEKEFDAYAHQMAEYVADLQVVVMGYEAHLYCSCFLPDYNWLEEVAGKCAVAFYPYNDDALRITLSLWDCLRKE